MSTDAGLLELVEGWELASTPPSACGGPSDAARLSWQPARVPGTAAAAVGPEGRDFDTEDWWFRTRFAADQPSRGEEVTLELDGIATVSEVYLNGRRVLDSASMWASHAVDVSGLITADNELLVVCRALAPLLAIRRRPAARWRTRVVNHGNLRWYRTMMFGRSPGFAPGPAAVGPWGAVRVTRRAPGAVRAISVRTRVEGGDGVVQIRALAPGDDRPLHAAVGETRVLARAGADGWQQAELRVPDPALWWPHTHGTPALHRVTLERDGDDGVVAARAVGFRTLGWARNIAEDGLNLHVNGIPVFARGAVWTPADLISMAPSPAELRRLLERVRDGGMNMLRVVGTGAYEPAVFHDLCDQLGILVWQDMMFANLDYPTTDPEFRAAVLEEARQVLNRLAGRPSLAVVCGNSEVEQQPAMLGLDPSLGRDELWDELLPRVVSDAGIDAVYVPSTPCGGVLPFHSDQGLAHYFGVSGYFRPVEDARRANVKFASECLAFANVPNEVEFPVHHPGWKAGVARDAGSGWGQGAGWDFDDVRDFYLQLLFGVDPVQLRRADHDRYLELSRAASGEVMAELMGEWRRGRSPCRGALVLWLKDMLPGAGLGVLDHRGEPKVAYHHLRRILAPIAVWSTDEGVNGVAVHVANDRAEPLRARLRVALYRDLETCVAQAEEELELSPHTTEEHNLERMIGRFVDAAWAYRFGPAAQDAIVVSLESGPDPGQLLSQAVRFPAARPTTREPATRLGLQATARFDHGGGALSLRSTRLAYGVRVDVPGFTPLDDAFSVEPGRERLVALRPVDGNSHPQGGSLTALNLDAPVKIEVLPQ